LKTELNEPSEAVLDLHPSLEQVVKEKSLNRGNLTVALRMPEKRFSPAPREEVLLYDGKDIAVWQVSSLRELFRGDKPAPFMGDEPPAVYQPWFFFIERHILMFCDSLGDKTDGEFEEAFSNLRRRPDSKSLSALHAWLWQAAACLVGTRPVSAGEFEAIFARLTRSARTFSDGPVSRNYILALRQMGEWMNPQQPPAR